MPDWMQEYLRQSPTLAICLGVVYLAWKYTSKLHVQFLDSLERSHASHLASKDAEIERLRADLDSARKERDRLQKQLTAAKEKS
jgi:hypothetical protein